MEIKAKKSEAMQFFEKDNSENCYNLLFGWQGHCLESKQVHLNIQSFSDCGYEWFKSLESVVYTENAKYFGITISSVQGSEFKSFTEVSKYYIEKKQISWALKNTKNYKHLMNTLRKKLKVKSIETLN